MAFYFRTEIVSCIINLAESSTLPSTSQSHRARILPIRNLHCSQQQPLAEQQPFEFHNVSQIYASAIVLRWAECRDSDGQKRLGTQSTVDAVRAREVYSTTHFFFFFFFVDIYLYFSSISALRSFYLNKDNDAIGQRQFIFQHTAHSRNA